jgi:hypothetical protein
MNCPRCSTAFSKRERHVYDVCLNCPKISHDSFLDYWINWYGKDHYNVISSKTTGIIVYFKDESMLLIPHSNIRINLTIESDFYKRSDEEIGNFIKEILIFN